MFFVDWGSQAELVSNLPFVPMAVAFVGSIASLFVRYRSADVLERTQLRWVFLAAVIALTSTIGSWVTGLDAWEVLTGMLYSIIPGAILVAVRRYGLYSIDRIISRTVSYSIVTLSAIGVYLVVVLAGSTLIPSRGAPAIVVAFATLAGAGVFLPLLSVTRRTLDRRFNREQYDAEVIARDFGERIRSGVANNSTAGDLVRAVEVALQPTAVGIWEPPRSKPAR